MFNSPLLDVTIGLVLIFLVYSLLATSINEALATLLSIRARMLKRAIVTGMLSDTSKDSQLLSLMKGIYQGSGIQSLCEWIKIIVHPSRALPAILMEKDPKNGFLSYIAHLQIVLFKRVDKIHPKLGDQFYDHPIIKNYGSNRIYASPSYISKNNFSTVLIDLLKKDFNEKITHLHLQDSADIIKIKELLEHYRDHYLEGNLIREEICYIQKDTLQILLKFLEDSLYDMGTFTKKIEEWFNDTMNRTSGWYKRQIQLVLFLLGLILAITFNINTIQIANKLSRDKDTRNQLVQMAITTAQNYKNDTRVQKITAPGSILNASDTTSVTPDFEKCMNNLDTIKKLYNHDVQNVNLILALGWGLDTLTKTDFIKLNLNTDSSFFKKYEQLKTQTSFIQLLQETKSIKIIRIDKIDTTQFQKSKIITVQVQRTYFWYESAYYIAKNATNGQTILGFLITAFAVSLGAPFWFDLLNKMVRIRGVGKKEESTKIATNAIDTTSDIPVLQSSNIITINQPQQQAKEAVG